MGVCGFGAILAKGHNIQPCSKIKVEYLKKMFKTKHAHIQWINELKLAFGET